MNPLALTLLLAALTVHPSPAREPSFDWAHAVAAPAHKSDPFGAVPRGIVVVHTPRSKLTIEPAGADGPSKPAPLDTMSAITALDRLKADRVAQLPAVGAGVVITLTRFR